MNRLPDWLKWIIVVVSLVLLAWVMLLVNDRASRVKMPDPDDMMGTFPTHSASSAAG